MKQTYLYYFLTAFLLAACSGASPGGVPGGSVGSSAVGGEANSLAGPGSGGAQPLDAGFSGPSKDVENFSYVSRDVQGRVVCEEANGDFQVKLSGRVFNKRTNYPVSGFLRISDSTAQKYLVTLLSHDEPVGNFSTVMKLRSPFELYFAVPMDSDPVLETLLPFGEGLALVVGAPPEQELVIEGSSGAFPCMHRQNSFEMAPEHDDSEESEEIPHIINTGPLHF